MPCKRCIIYSMHSHKRAVGAHSLQFFSAAWLIMEILCVPVIWYFLIKRLTHTMTLSSFAMPALVMGFCKATVPFSSCEGSMQILPLFSEKNFAIVTFEVQLCFFFPAFCSPAPKNICNCLSFLFSFQSVSFTFKGSKSFVTPSPGKFSHTKCLPTEENSNLLASCN